MFSVDFAEIDALQQQGRWDEATAFMVEAARRVERGGADYVLLCTNTMHKMAGDVQESVAIPLLHIANATGERIVKQDFYRGRLQERYSLAVLIPDVESTRPLSTPRPLSSTP